MKKVSESVINRLPRYYRYLGELLVNGTSRISSKELSERMNVTASQIRQDFNTFGGFGQQGYGYNVEYLHSEIGNILGLKKGYTAILVGAGNMGRAFAVNTNFEKRGFKLIGIFDVDPKKIGNSINDIKILDYREIEGFIKQHNPDMAILAVPRLAIQEVANNLIEYGLKGLLNFTYTEFDGKEGIAIENVHLSDSLMRLSYKITQNNS